DVDEPVSPELRAEIQETFANPGLLNRFVAFSFPRLTYYCGRWIRHGDWYPDRVTRLWRRGLAVWGGVSPHAMLVVQGEVRKLRSNLLHFNADSMDQQITKLCYPTHEF